MSVPWTKQCHAGVGHKWDHVRGDNSGDDGTGDELSAAAAAALDLDTVVDKYLRRGWNKCNILTSKVFVSS